MALKWIGLLSIAKFKTVRDHKVCSFILPFRNPLLGLNALRLNLTKKVKRQVKIVKLHGHSTPGLKGLDTCAGSRGELNSRRDASTCRSILSIPPRTDISRSFYFHLVRIVCFIFFCVCFATRNVSVWSLHKHISGVSVEDRSAISKLGDALFLQMVTNFSCYTLPIIWVCHIGITQLHCELHIFRLNFLWGWKFEM